MDKNQVLREAQKYTAKGLTDKALEEWSKYLSLCPDDGAAYNSVGDLYLKKRATADAVNVFRKAAEIFSKEGFHLKAMAVFKKVITLDPSIVEIYVAMADLEGTRGFVASAREYLVKAADLCRSRGAIADSVSIYRKLVDLDPANNAQRIRLADALIAAGKRDEGIHVYLEAAARYGQDGKEAEATTIYDKLAEIDPTRPEVVIGSVRRLLREGKADDAVEAMKPLITPDQSEPFLLSTYGEACLASGQIEEAIGALSRAMEADPQRTQTRGMLSEALFKAGNAAAATTEIQSVIDDFRHAQDWEQMAEALMMWVAYAPPNPDIHQKLYEVYLKLGRPDDALRELKAVGSIHYDDGRLHKALNIYEHVLREDPSDITAPLRIEEIRGKLAEAGEEGVLMVTSADTGISLDDFQEEVILANSDAAPFELETFDMDSQAPSDHPIMSSADEITLDLDEDQSRGISIDLSGSGIDLEPTDLKPDIMEHLIEEAPGSFGISLDMDDEGGLDIPHVAPAMEETAESFGIPFDVADEGGLDMPFDTPSIEKTPAAPRSTIPAEVLAENMEEADFFARQGMVAEARRIYEKIMRLAPDCREAAERLAALDETADVSGDLEVLDEPTVLELGDDSGPDEISLTGPAAEMSWMEEKEAGIAEAGIERFMGLEGIDEEAHTVLHETDDATFEGQTDEQPLTRSLSPWEDDEQLKDAFEDFKDGINRQIDAGDADTRYNLGIAYKEMGLLDEAVSEFTISARNPQHTLSSCTMLELCYQDMGRADDAAAALKRGLGVPGLAESDRLALVYELARFYEKQGKKAEAMSSYENILEFDPNYRDVPERAAKLSGIGAGNAEKKQRISYL